MSDDDRRKHGTNLANTKRLHFLLIIKWAIFQRENGEGKVKKRNSRGLRGSDVRIYQSVERGAGGIYKGKKGPSVDIRRVISPFYKSLFPPTCSMIAFRVVGEKE